MFKYILLASALFISSCAAWFSISGISQLFIGSPKAAIFMALSLELGKLVSASFIYRHWKTSGKILRTYMLIGVIILSAITSTGIYGYLSSSYASAATQFNAQQNQIGLLTTQQSSLNSLIQNNTTHIQQLQSYRSQQETRLNSLVGHTGFLTQQRVVREAETDIRNLENQTRQFTQQRDSLEIKKVQSQNTLQTDSRIGTFWYVAKTLGVSLDTIVKWFTLIIVCVFDPMAIALIISYNVVDKTKRESSPNESSNGVKNAPESPINVTPPQSVVIDPINVVNAPMVTVDDSIHPRHSIPMSGAPQQI